jgi:glycerol-3-phosphate acyltransferase PlsY
VTRNHSLLTCWFTDVRLAMIVFESPRSAVGPAYTAVATAPMFPSILIAYLIGSIPFALLLSRWSGAPDPRRVGSGNVGAANVLRVSGAWPALLVALLDAGKGVAGVAVARYLEGSAAPAAGVAAIVGHIYPVWLGFSGGKGVATACGAFTVLAPAATVLSLVAFAVAVLRTGYASVGSLLATAVLPIGVYWTSHDRQVLMASFGAAALIVFRHRANLARLRAGTESRFHRAGVSDRVRDPNDGSA